MICIIHRATIYFRDDLHTSPLVGALGFACFSLAMAVGRLYSDKLGETYGRSHLLRAGGGLGAAGLGMSVLAPAVFTGAGVVVLAVIGLTLSGDSRGGGQIGMHVLVCCCTNMVGCVE